MTQLALVAMNPAVRPPVSVRFAHDIRNTISTAALHLETLERLAGPRGAKTASAAHALIAKAASMCSDAIREQTQADAPARPTGFDIVRTIQQIADLLSPIVPDGFSMRVRTEGSVLVLANPPEVFRILFNLAHNAVTVARRGKRMSHVEFTVERRDATVAVRIADDGPGLPKAVNARLFRKASDRTATGGNGHGLAIARELAERNGGTLELTPAKVGTAFTLVLPALAMAAVKEGPVTRSLGQRLMRS